MEELTGEVSLEVTAAGSKGERRSVVLRPDGGGGEVVLRTRQPITLSAEPALSAYAGQRVRVRGQAGLASFVVDKIEVVEPFTEAEQPDGP